MKVLEAPLTATKMDAPSHQEDVEMPQDAASAQSSTSAAAPVAAAAKVGTSELSLSTDPTGPFGLLLHKSSPSEIYKIY